MPRTKTIPAKTRNSSPFTPAALAFIGQLDVAQQGILIELAGYFGGAINSDHLMTPAQLADKRARDRKHVAERRKWEEELRRREAGPRRGQR